MPASSADEQSLLTDEDVNLLHEIVIEAESVGGPRPFRALFTAYDNVLARHGFDPNHDKRYFGFITRMPAGRREGDTLFTRFQQLLRQVGIEVDRGEDGEAIGEITRHFDYPQVNGDQDVVHQRKAHSRRASFSSVYDSVPAQATQDNEAEGNVEGRRQLAIQNARTPRAPSASSVLDGRRRARSHSASRPLAQLPIGGRMNGRIVSDQLPYRPKRSGSVTTQSQRGSPRNDTPQDQDDYSADDSAEPTQELDEQWIHRALNPTFDQPVQPVQTVPRNPYQAPEVVLYKPSETQMIDDAETFQYHRTLPIARHILRKWHDDALRLEEEHERMDILASAKDRNTLLRQTFTEWHDALQEKRQIAETERFFSHLEGRASKARNLFLLTKAFTHWAQSASDEVQRTSVARRHILRTRYFNAWRDITAVNELKVRRFGLQKFLNIWRRRTAAVEDDNVTAIIHYRHRLVERVFREWLWGLRERQASVFRDIYLARTFFVRWSDVVTQLRERENFVENMRVHKVQGTILQAWREKTNAVHDLEPQVQDFYRKTLLSTALRTLQRQAQLRPAAIQLTQRVDYRLVSTSFRTWHIRAQQSRQAREVDRMRVMRNTWTAWNDRLRVHALAVQINDRVLVQTLYKWTLASRASLFLRVNNAQLQRNLFVNWANKTQDRETRLKAAEQRFARSRRTRLLRTNFDKLRTATQTRQDQEALALTVYEPKLTQKTFNMLVERQQHFAQLNEWAANGRFYVLATNTIKRWKDATQVSRRVRRRENYTEVRRIVKLNTAKRALTTWRDKTALIGFQEQQAAGLDVNHVLRTTANFFSQWHDRAIVFVQLQQQADDFRRKHLFRTSMTVLKQRHQQLQDLNQQAVSLERENTYVSATKSLRSLEWRLFQIRRGEQNALALQERNREKHIRAMIRFWAEQAADRAANRVGSPSPTPDRRGGGTGDDGGASATTHELEDTIALNENWTEFDDSTFEARDLDLSFSLSPGTAANTRANATGLDLEPDPNPPFLTSTPLPGYLRTPSKRSAARQKARERLAAESNVRLIPFNYGAASAPVVGFADPPASASRSRITPFERKLREHGVHGDARGRRGRGRGAVGFEDITEEGVSGRL